MKNTETSQYLSPEKSSIDKGLAEIISEEASLWLLQLDGEVTLEEKQAFEQWLMRSPEHTLIYQQLKSLWCLGDQLSVDDFSDDLAKLPKQAPQDQSLFSTIKSMFSFLTMRQSMYTAALGSALFMVTFMFTSIEDNVNLNTVVQQKALNHSEYSTRLAEHRTVITDDGSIVNLAGKTRITVNFTENERNIYLHQGEALFTVAKDKNRPFIVHNNKRVIQAIGTMFNVRESKTQLEVSVLEGVVKVQSFTTDGITQKKDSSSLVSNSAKLIAGQAMKVNSNGIFSSKLDISISDKMDWQQGRMSYVDTNLSNVVFDLKRYSSLNIHITDKTVADMGYTGSVIYEKIDDWLIALPYIFPIEVLREGNTVVISAN